MATKSTSKNSQLQKIEKQIFQKRGMDERTLASKVNKTKVQDLDCCYNLKRTELAETILKHMLGIFKF